MDYEKAYKEAIERAKKVLLDCTSEERKIVEYAFPELAESEDERIRKEILAEYKVERDTISDCITTEYDDTDEADKLRLEWLNDVIAYLEKQKDVRTIDDVAKEITKDRNSAITFLKNTGIMDENGELTEKYRTEEKKEQKLTECINIEKLAEYIKAEFESFRNLLKKK